MGRPKSPAPKTFARQLTDKQREIEHKKRKVEFAKQMAQLPETSIEKEKFLRLVHALTAEFRDDFTIAASALAALQVLCLNFSLAHSLFHRWIESFEVVPGSCGSIRRRRDERRDDVLRKRRTRYSYSRRYGGMKIITFSLVVAHHGPRAVCFKLYLFQMGVHKIEQNKTAQELAERRLN